MQRHSIESPAAWHGPALLKRTDWIHTLSGAEIDEIERALVLAKSSGATLASIDTQSFPLVAFPRIVERLRETLEHGPGMFLIRGFPTEHYQASDLRMIYWALGKYLGTAVTQSAAGDILGDVRDLKVDLSGPKGRGYKTNAELKYHTDSCDVVALFVLRTAKSGGRSMIASSVAIHNEILRRRPDLLEVLYQPFTWSLQNQNRAGDKPTYEQPIFTMHAGHFACRYIRTHIRSAQRYPEVPRLTDAQNDAIALLDSIAADESMHFSMMFEPGDIQILNNHVCLHARTHFEDHDEPDRKRHLLRMWLSMPNTRPLSPALSQIYKDRRPGAVRGGFPSRSGGIVFETTET